MAIVNRVIFLVRVSEQGFLNKRVHGGEAL